MPDDDVGLGHERVNIAQELLAAALVPLGELDNLVGVVPLRADDRRARLALDGLVVDVSVLEVAAVPPELSGDPGQPLDVEDQDLVADPLVDGEQAIGQAHSGR